MSDFVPIPIVCTRFNVDGFTLYVYAYRRVSKEEGHMALELYKKQHRVSVLPKNGFGKVFTQFGSNPADGI